MILALATFVLLMAAGALYLSASHTSQPVYQGKELSSWLEAYDPYLRWKVTPAQKQEADAAVSHIGTNSIPTLLRMLRARDWRWSARFLEWLSKVRIFKIKRSLPAENLQFAAANAFSVLGTEASNAVPKLIEIYKQNISESSRYYTVLSLWAIGPAANAAVPTLVESMPGSKPEIRSAIVSEFARIHANPELVVPALIKNLNDPQPLNRQDTVRLLGSFGTNAKQATSDLNKLRNDPSDTVRREVTNALKSINPDE